MPPAPRRQPMPSHPPAAAQPQPGVPADQPVHPAPAGTGSPFAELGKELAVQSLRAHLEYAQQILGLSDEDMDDVRKEVLGGG